MQTFHDPVLLQESVDGLAVRREGTYVDATFGGGGHSAAILQRLGAKGRLLAFDRDQDALKNAPDDPRLTLIHHNYRHLRNYLRYYNAIPADGILADLGISSHQIDRAERGFSTRFEGELDMRMDRRRKRTAATVVMTAERDTLIRIFRTYGEVDHPGKVADAILRARATAPIRTTGDLKQALAPLVPRGLEQKFYARIFQALRIEVNGELEAVEQLLSQSLSVLKQGGRLVVISYHSLEDRLVKNFMKTGNIEGKEDKDPIYGHVTAPFTPITRKAVVASEEEIARNGRARSAKMRIAEKN
jgi:16S rRNA (cytosine1402-N4)-methyltransferase